MENEVRKSDYPLLHLPKSGTVLYPFRRLVAGSSNRIAKAFVLRLREWLPEEVQVLDDVWVNLSEQLPPLKVSTTELTDPGAPRMSGCGYHMAEAVQ